MLMEDSATTSTSTSSSSVSELFDTISRIKQIRVRSEGNKNCIKTLSYGIQKGTMLLSKLSKDDEGRVYRLLADAYCIRALCRQEDEPSSSIMKILPDIIDATKMWSRLEKSHKMSPSSLILLYQCLDLLSLKGYTNRHATILRHMSRFCLRRDIPFETCLKWLWNSRSVSHALCPSIMIGDFINMLPPMPHDPDKSSFSKAFIYYDLGEKLMTRGYMAEALVYARKAKSLRAKLFEEYFSYNKTAQEETSALSGLSMHNNKANIKNFKIKDPMAVAYWPFDEDLSKIGDCILTPWNVLRCYLESLLQVGTILELHGYNLKAEVILKWGQQIAFLQHLSIFSVSFSTVIGKLYRKTQQWELADHELTSAEKNLSFIPCKKCKILLEATVQKQRGDFFRSHFLKTDVGPSSFINAEKNYKGARKNLEHITWENYVSESKEPTASSTPLCDASFASNVVGSTNELSRDGEKCWHCLASTVKTSLRCVIFMEWECVRRRILLGILVGIGKCFQIQKKTADERNILMESACLLIRRNTLKLSTSSISLPDLLQLIKRNGVADRFAIEQASVLYNLSWVELRDFNTRNSEDDSSGKFLSMQAVVSALKLAFILSHDVPALFQKVSQLLAALYTVSPWDNKFNEVSSNNVPTKSQWAWYFHQASLGTHTKVKRNKDDDDGSCQSSSISVSLPRLAPESIVDLEGFILDFIRDLQRVTIVSISMFEDRLAEFLRKLLPCIQPTDVWIMLSRMDSNSIPFVVVLPAKRINCKFNKEESDPVWSLWGATIVNKVAPMFTNIVGEVGSTPDKRCKLDELLSAFLRRMQRNWFGPWIHLCFGDYQNHNPLHSILEELRSDLKTKFQVDVPESIIKSVIGHDSQQVECVAKLILNERCYVDGNSSSNQEVTKVCQLISDALHKTGEEGSLQRGPVILVLDVDIQMLPWENLPDLRYKEIYRMPSVASINTTFNRCCHYREKVGQVYVGFPRINPRDAYYLLDPDGNIPSVQSILKDWLSDKNLLGKTGIAPSVEELKKILQNCQFYLYVGHDDGSQYIPRNIVEKLDRCAVAILMGCASGVIKSEGPYRAVGTPLDYLNGGSPLVIANLWGVRGDVGYFTKSLVSQCLEIESVGDQGQERRIGQFMEAARDQCAHKFLFGGAPVCFGVPTSIIFNKKDRQQQ